MAISRSMVITCTRRVRLMRSTSAAISVRFPLERGPAMTTSPSDSPASA